MGFLDWFLLMLPAPFTKTKEPQSDEGVALRVINNYRTSQRLAQQEEDSEEAAREQEAEEFTADQAAKERQHNDRIALEVYAIENHVSTTRNESREEGTKQSLSTEGFDTWLVSQGKEPPANTDFSLAMKDFILHPDQSEPTNDYEPS